MPDRTIEVAFARDEAAEQVGGLVARHAAAHAVAAPSLVVAVFDAGGLVAVAGGGALRDGGGPPGAGSIYRIASMSKSFCAVAVLRLVERGVLRLDQPVAEIVPDFRLASPHAGLTPSVTVRMLLTNSSGLPEDNAWADPHLGMDREELRALLRAGVRLGDLPGYGYQYSNLGFGVLGLVVEACTGLPFQTVVEQEVIAPLGLERTGYAVEELEQRGLAADIASGYSTFDDGRNWVARPFAGNGALASIGGLFSSVDDVARWAGWLCSAFRVEGAGMDDPILSPSSRRLMQSAHTLFDADARWQRPTLAGSGYGMGVIVETDRRFGRFVQHSGGLPGFSSHMRWHADSGRGVVAFRNADGASLAPLCADLLGEWLLGDDLPARRVPVWAETLATAARIDQMLRNGADFEATVRDYADNVADDIPLAVRSAAAAALFGSHGGPRRADGLDARLLWAESGAQLAWSIPCVDGELAAEIEMTAVGRPLVQRITLVPIDAVRGERAAMHGVPIRAERPGGGR